MFGSDYSSITVAFLPQTENRLRVKVYTKTEERWEVPVTITGIGVEVGGPGHNYRYEGEV